MTPSRYRIWLSEADRIICSTVNLRISAWRFAGGCNGYSSSRFWFSRLRLRDASGGWLYARRDRFNAQLKCKDSPALAHVSGGNSRGRESSGGRGGCVRLSFFCRGSCLPNQDQDHSSSREQQSQDLNTAVRCAGLLCKVGASTDSDRKE